MTRMERRERNRWIVFAVVMAVLFAANALFPEWFGGRWW